MEVPFKVTRNQNGDAIVDCQWGLSKESMERMIKEMHEDPNLRESCSFIITDQIRIKQTKQNTRENHNIVKAN